MNGNRQSGAKSGWVRRRGAGPPVAKTMGLVTAARDSLQGARRDDAGAKTVKDRGKLALALLFLASWAASFADAPLSLLALAAP